MISNSLGCFSHYVSRCPDMEGIETTLTHRNVSAIVPMSVGAPTWRGLKPYKCGFARIFPECQ